MNYLKSFGEKLATARREFRSEKYRDKGPSLRELAQESGVGFGLIGAIENGRKRAGEKTLRKLAAALQLGTKETEELVMVGREVALLDRVEELMSQAEFEHFARWKLGIPAISADMLKRDESDEIEDVSKFVYSDPSCDVLLELANGEYVAVKVMTGRGETRDTALEALEQDLRRHLPDVDSLLIELELGTGRQGEAPGRGRDGELNRERPDGGDENPDRVVTNVVTKPDEEL